MTQRQPQEETITTEIKIGNTHYIVTAYFAPYGVTASEKVKRLLKQKSKQNVEKSSVF